MKVENRKSNSEMTEMNQMNNTSPDGRSLRTPVSPITPIASQTEREQALRDYKVTIEYKHLKQHAPTGVYLIPSGNDLRYFYGVIFVRRGPFANGIFKFQVRLPEKYNDVDTWPQISFTSYVFNPHVDVETGDLDVKVAYPKWDPHKHYLVTVLTHLKKIFYQKKFDTSAAANEEALDLATNNSSAYRKKVEACVHESQRSVFMNDEGSTTRFTEEEVAHQVLRDLLKEHVEDPASLSRSVILDIISRSHNPVLVSMD